MATDTPNAEFSDTRKKRQKLGLQDRGVTTVECVDCSKHLMVFQITKNNEDLEKPVSTKILIECGFCGGMSYVKNIDGQFYPGAANDNILFEPLDPKTPKCFEYDVLFRAWPKKR